jgi:hypothetical protein
MVVSCPPPVPLFTMDIIHLCLALAPVPYLAHAFSALRFIWSSVEQTQASKRQLEVLAQSIAQLLQVLDGQYRAGRLLQVKTAMPLADLSRFVVFTMLCILRTHRSTTHRLLDEISAFVQKETLCAFLKLLFTKNRRISRIEEYHHRIGTLVTSFQASCHILALLHQLA